MKIKIKPTNVEHFLLFMIVWPLTLFNFFSTLTFVATNEPVWVIAVCGVGTLCGALLSISLFHPIRESLQRVDAIERLKNAAIGDYNG